MSVVPSSPSNMPVMGNACSRFIGRVLLRAMGWKLTGKFPNEPKLMIALAPHTSNWDFVVAMPVIMAVGVKVSFLMKKEAFFWPLNKLFAWWGAIPTERGEANDMVEQVAAWYGAHDQVWVAITPEGTRKKAERWKTGFLRIAYRAEIPVFLVAWDYPNKRLHCDRLFTPTGDHAADLVQIQEHFTQGYTACKVDHQ